MFTEGNAPSARQQMLDDIAQQLGLPKDSLHQRLAAGPELLARMLTRVLPPTPRRLKPPGGSVVIGRGALSQPAVHKD
jgi:hypothetical protein